MTKPTASQVWRQLVDEAGEDEIAAVLSMTQEQVDAELAGAGFDLAQERAKADRFLEDLASGALEADAAKAEDARRALYAVPSAVLAVAQLPPPERTERRRRPRTALVLLVAATAAAAAGGAAYTMLHHEPAPSPPSPQPPELPPTPAPSSTEAPVPDLVAAEQWRQRAVAACDAKRWTDCLVDLDKARALDPAGDETPRVKSLRDRASRGIMGK
jgi:hypothetical protein